MPRSGLRQKARGKIPRAVMKKGMSMKGKSFAPHKTVGQALCVAASAPYADGGYHAQSEQEEQQIIRRRGADGASASASVAAAGV